jgi:hypothetical protein
MSSNLFSATVDPKARQALSGHVMDAVTNSRALIP